MSLLHTEGLLTQGEEEEEQVHTQFALVEKWREVEKANQLSKRYIMRTAFNTSVQTSYAKHIPYTGWRPFEHFYIH